MLLLEDILETEDDMDLPVPDFYNRPKVLSESEVRKKVNSLLIKCKISHKHGVKIRDLINKKSTDFQELINFLECLETNIENIPIDYKETLTNIACLDISLAYDILVLYVNKDSQAEDILQNSLYTKNISLNILEDLRLKIKHVLQDIL